MASSKTERTWADLQESFTRVRQQYGLIPRVEWGSLIARTSYENAVPAKQRNKYLSNPFLPSLTEDTSNTSVNRKENYKRNDSVFHENFVMKKKGHREKTRSKSEHGSFKYFLENQTFAWNFVDSLISEILLDEIVPDVLIEALTHSSTQNLLQPQKSYHKGWKRDKNSETLLMANRETLQTFSRSLMDELLVEVLQDLSVLVIRSTVKDFVDDHLLTATVYNIMDEMLTSTIQTELPLVIEEVREEMQLEYVIRDVTKKEVILSAKNNLIDTFLLEHLIEMIGENKPVMFGNDHSLRLLDSFVLDILLTQHLSIDEKQQATSENDPMSLPSKST
ncbi:uncharacterized protein LOC142497068 isoform X2 [Ascaphus truei]|uniref:uncharacterized protein LOC142497068 isoform X2 n=1 Tax=Ascaphus truei TaxID=8439 RepID=UPI003F5A68AE